MGMHISDDAHASVRGLKLSGLLSSTANECGFSVDMGFMLLSRADVRFVLSEMIRSLESGRVLADGSCVVHAQSLRDLAIDARKAERLLLWLALSDDAELTFA